MTNNYLLFSLNQEIKVSHSDLDQIKACKFITSFKFLPILKMALVSSDNIEKLNEFLLTINWKAQKTEG